jgi:ribosome biogenesis GTPase
MPISFQPSLDYSPEAWGWKPDLYAAWSQAVDADPNLGPCRLARVTARERHLYEVVCPDFTGRPGFARFDGHPVAFGLFTDVRVSGRFEHGAAGSADYPVIGDWVLVDGEGVSVRLRTVLSRRSALSRGSAGPRSEEQALAANVDVVFLVFALDGGRNFLLRFLERALVVAKNSGASCCIVLNKADLASAEARADAISAANRAAPLTPVVALSARTGEGVGDLSSIVSPGETVCMLGQSGVGKSALVNALAGVAPVAREGSVREDDLRGRHTTTSSRLYRLESGLLLIDSPGIRELKILGDADALAGGFPEIAELASRCRFADCGHGSEPGCAVRDALESGSLDGARYRAYLDLAREQAWMERRIDDRARRENDLKWKRISKFQKELKKRER